MKKILFGLVFLFLLVFGGLFFAVQYLVTPEFISNQVQQAVQSNTGRELRLNQTPRLTYWPKLSVELRDVSLSNPPQMQEGTFASMESMRVQMDVASLLSGRVQIEEISLNNPTIEMLIDESGKASWSLDNGSGEQTNSGSDGSASGSSFTNPIEEVSLAPITISSGRISYIDQRKGTQYTADNVNMTITQPNLTSPLKVQGAFVWNDQPIEMSLFVEEPQNISATGSATELVIESELLTASYGGKLSVQNGFELAGKVDASTPSIRKLALWTGNPIAQGTGLQQFAAASELAISENAIRLGNGQFSLDGMNANGDLNIDVSGNVPFVSGNLGVDKIDVNIYLENEAANAGQGSQSGGTSTTGNSEWSNERIDFSGLQAVNAELAMVTSSILYRDVSIGKTRLKASVKNGILDAMLNEMEFYDGIAKGSIRVSSSNSTISANLDASGLDGNRFLSDFAEFNRITGRTGLNVNVNASGRSQKEIVSSLNGVAGFKFEDGALNGINIPRMVRSVQSNILGGWQSSPEEKTDFSVLQANFDIKNGVATNNDLILASPLLRVTGAGLANMPGQDLDYRVEPKVVGSLVGQGGTNELTGLKVPVIIRGPWSDPKIFPDIQGILEDPQAAFDALSKLTGADTGINIEQEQEQLKEKVTEEIQNTINKVVPEETKELLGEETNKLLEEQGKSLLNNLFGGSE